MRSITRTWLVTFLTAIAMVPLTGLANAQQLVRSPAAQLSATSGDAVITWNKNAAAAALGACLAPANNPLYESRMYAMMHIAIHDALNAIDRRSRPYVLKHVHARGASPDAAVAAAARGVLVPLLQQLPPPFSGCVTGRRSSRVWRLSMQRPSAPSPMVGRRCEDSVWDGPPPRPSSWREQRTVRTRRCSIRRTPKALSPASTGSHQAPTSRSLPAGRMSPRSS
jgi:hypothetical protein